MDIIAYVTNDGTLLLHRTTSWQRLMPPIEVSPDGAITAMCWSPNGRNLATGHANGMLRVLEVEQIDSESQVEALGGTGALSSLELRSRIDVMVWSVFLDTSRLPTTDPWELCRVQGAKLASAYLERGDALLPLPKQPLGEGIIRRTSEFRDLYNGLGEPHLDIEHISLLASIDATGQALLSIEGQFTVAQVDISHTFPMGAPHFPAHKEAHKTAVLSANLGRLMVWGHATHQSSALDDDESTSHGRLSTLVIDAIEYSKLELVPCAKQYFNCSSLLETARDALATARQKYHHVLAHFDDAIFNKYVAIVAQDKGEQADFWASRPAYVNMANELLKTLTSGLSFLAKPEAFIFELLPTENQIIKLHKQLDSSLLAADCELEDRLIRASKHLFYRASEMEALAKCGPVCGFDKVGLDEVGTRRFFQACRLFAIKAEEVAEGLRFFRSHLSILCAWLSDIAMMAHARRQYHLNRNEENEERKAAASDEVPQQQRRKPMPLAATTPKTARHYMQDLMDLLINTIENPPSTESLSITERLLVGPYELSRALCDPEPPVNSPEFAEAETRFLLGNTNGYDASRRLPVSEPSAEDEPLSLCGRLRECCELADLIFHKVRETFAERNCHLPTYDLRLGARPLDVALHARISDADDDDGSRVLCAIATADNHVWLLDLLPDAAISARRFAIEPPIIRVDFYGAQAGYRNKHKEKLVLLVGPKADQQANTEPDHLWIFEDDSRFQNTPSLSLASPAHPDKDPFIIPLALPQDVKSLALPLLTPNSPDTGDHPLINLAMRHNVSLGLFVSGCRGVAAIIGRPNYLTLYDLEDYDEDEDDDDDNDDGEAQQNDDSTA